MATTTPDHPEFEGRMHTGDAARAVVAKMAGGVRQGLTGSPSGSVRRLGLLLMVAWAGVAMVWAVGTDPIEMLLVNLLGISALMVLAFDSGRQRG